MNINLEESYAMLARELNKMITTNKKLEEDNLNLKDEIARIKCDYYSLETRLATALLKLKNKEEAA